MTHNETMINKMRSWYNKQSLKRTMLVVLELRQKNILTSC